MDSKASKKKLKMERLSPIPAQDRPHLLSETPCTPVQSKVPPSRRQKDTYAIETTSSPDFGKLPTGAGSSLQKPRRYRHIVRKSTKNSNSTPLTGLIARQPVAATPREGLQCSDPFSSNSSDMPSPHELGAQPQIDEFSPQKPLHSPRHSEIISATAVFPPKPLPITSNATPLAGIVNKRVSTLNLSLNDSITILQEAEDPSDDEVAPDASLDVPQTEKISIESFESPRKPACALRPSPSRFFKTFRPYSSRSLDKSDTNKLYCLRSPLVENITSDNGEMCGTERKNRKRALDFNCTMFEAPKHKLNAVRDESLLSMTLPCSQQEGDCTSPSRVFERGSRSPVIDVVPPCAGGDGEAPVLDPAGCLSLVPPLHSRKLEESRESPVVDFLNAFGEGSRSPVLDLKFVSNDLEDDQVSNQQSCRKLENERESPVVDFSVAFGEESRSPELDLKSFSYDRERDSPSPVLVNFGVDFGPQRLEPAKESPVLDLTPARSENVPRPPAILMSQERKELANLKSSNRDRQRDIQSPTLDLNAACRQREDGCPPDSVSHLYLPESNFQPVEPLKKHSPVEKQEEDCPSDTDSIIESTPNRPKPRHDNSGGFIASSRLEIEDKSPTSVKSDTDHFEIPKIEVFEETNSNTTDGCNLKFVVSHDSSDESINHSDDDQVIKDSCDMVLPTIGHSPGLELNYTKRPIQPFESPSKSVKPFSEAVHIGDFGSPHSNASCHHDEVVDGTTDDVVEPSTTQEYVEESEQVRPTKRRKKGSLWERVKGVIAKVDASNALFDYELKCGLRPTQGKFVSAPLVVVKPPNETSSVFLVCKPYKYCKTPSNEDISSFVIVHINKLPLGVSDGSVVLLHFPLNVSYFSDWGVPCVMAGHQIVLHPTESKIDVSTVDVHPLESINRLGSPYSRPSTSFRTFSSVLMRTLSEAALGQNLVEDSYLFLTVFHVTKLYEKTALEKILVLCGDEEFVYCWLEFSSERDIKRAVALETLSVLSDGSQIQTKGFSVVDRSRLDRKTKNLISYCSSNVVNNEIIFSVRPKDTDWVISLADGPVQRRKDPSKVGDILSKKIPGYRYLVEVHGVEKEPNLAVKDSEGQGIDFVVGGNSCLTLEQPLPLFLDAVYFYDGRLFSDEHSKAIQKM